MQYTSEVFKYLKILFESKLNTAQFRLKSEKSCLW